MNSFVDYQRRASAIINELISLTSQYQRAIDHGNLWGARELSIKMRRRREELGLLKSKMLEALKGYFEFNTFKKPKPKPADHLFNEASQNVERIEKLYIFLEQLAINEARHFPNHQKGRLRKARSDVQRIRLWLYDITGTKPAKRIPTGISDQRHSTR